MSAEHWLARKMQLPGPADSEVETVQCSSVELDGCLHCKHKLLQIRTSQALLSCSVLLPDKRIELKLFT
jgi:hypothetical protein